MSEFILTPIGAAHVEAMPDKKKRRRIEKRFKENGECPTSDLFNAEQVESFYAARGMKIKAIEMKVKGQN